MFLFLFFLKSTLVRTYCCGFYSPFTESFLMRRSGFDLRSILGGSPPVANVVREDFDEVECLNRKVLPADKLSHTTAVCGNGIGSGSDRSTYNDVVRTDSASVSRSHNSYLVALISVSKSYTGGYGYKILTAN